MEITWILIGTCGLLIPSLNNVSTATCTNTFNLLVFRQKTDEEARVKNLYSYVTDSCSTVKKYDQPSLLWTWKIRSHLSLYALDHDQKNKVLRDLSAEKVFWTLDQFFWVIYRAQYPSSAIKEKDYRIILSFFYINILKQLWKVGIRVNTKMLQTSC